MTPQLINLPSPWLFRLQQKFLDHDSESIFEPCSHPVTVRPRRTMVPAKSAASLHRPLRSNPRAGGFPQCSDDGTFPIVAGYRAFFQYSQEIKMRKLIVAACCAALVGSMSVASAQTTTGPAGQQAVKASDPMNAKAKAKATKKKHKTKKSMTKSDTK
jgi:hypothetical protein